MEADTKLKGGFASFCIKNVKYSDANNELLRSKEGSRMIRVDMSVTDSEGFTDTIYEYMTSKTTWKNKQIEKVLGLRGKLTDYLNGLSDASVLEHIIGESGMCAIKMDKSKDPRYEDKMVISAYLANEMVASLKGAPIDKAKGAKPVKEAPKVEIGKKIEPLDDEDDGIPF